MSSEGAPAHSLGKVLEVLEGLWPHEGAEEWDAPGLVVGNPQAQITSIHLMVDVTSESVNEALEQGADLIIAHHPLLLRGVTTVAESTYKGQVIAALIRGGCAFVTAHTNADAVPSGTSARLADLLELVDHHPLSEGVIPGHGLGRRGILQTPRTLYEVAVALGEILPHTAVGPVVSGDPEKIITTVSLCAGAGDSLVSHPEVLSSDVYITSDLRHHVASEASEQAKLHGGPALINISHFAAEWLWLDQAAEQLERELGIAITVGDLNTDPWTFQVQRVESN